MLFSSTGAVYVCVCTAAAGSKASPEVVPTLASFVLFLLSVFGALCDTDPPLSISFISYACGCASVAEIPGLG